MLDIELPPRFERVKKWVLNGPSPWELIKQSLTSTREGYDLIAPKFDHTMFATNPAVAQRIADYLYLLNEERYDNAIDLCAGTGAGVSALMSIVRERVVGVDWSAPMLAEIRKKFAPDLNWPTKPDLELVCEDIFNLKHEESFDLAICFGAEGHIERHKQKYFLKIVHGLLRPGGVFAIVPFEKPRWYSPKFWLASGFDMIMKIRNRLIKPEFVMYYLNFMLPEALDLFDKDKWSSVRVVPITINKRPSLLRLVIAKKSDPV